MKKILFTILTFFAMFMIFGQQEQVQIEQFKQQINLTNYLLNYDHKDIQLAQGVDLSKITDTKKINDFSKPFPTTEYKMVAYNVNSENNFFAGYATDSFYNTDFAEDPFDGVIQVLVMGEPLPSPTVTLICAIGVIGILLYCKKRKEVII